MFRFTPLLICLTFMVSCQQDPDESKDQETNTGAPPKLERTGPDVVFQVLNAEEELVHNIKVFETASLSSGTVYQFSRGEGQVNFEEGPEYKLRAPGYKDMTFRLEGVDRLTRILFYMWREDVPSEGFSVSGQVKADNFRAFGDVTVVCNGESISTDDQGSFFFSPQFDEQPTQLPITFQWPVTKMEMSEMKIILLEKPDFPIRISPFLQTNTVLAPKQKADH